MTSITIIMGSDRKLQGISEEANRAYSKFKRTVRDLDIGETLEFTFTIPRSPKHHRRFMKIVRDLLACTEAFDDFDAIRDWMVTGAGYIEKAEGATEWTPVSLSFSSLDEVQFSELVHRVTTFLWSDRAQSYLWRNQSAGQRADTLRSVLERPE